MAEEKGKPRVLWHADPRQDISQRNEVTSRLPLELDVIIEGYGMYFSIRVLSNYKSYLFSLADGRIRQSSLIEMCRKSQPSSHTKVSGQPLQGYITHLHAVYPPTREKLIIGGADDGSIAFWTVECVIPLSLFCCEINYCISQFKLCARWTVFLTPLANVLLIDEKQSGPLSECVLCISADGTIAVIAIDGFQL